MNTHAQVPLGEVCKINPRTKAPIHLADPLVSFVPMAAVDERLGAVTVCEDRPLAEVSKGYTSFEDGDVLFAKITPSMENGKAALARNLTNGVGRGSTEFHVLRPGRRVLGEYVYHFVRQRSFRDEAKRSFTGTAGQQRVPKSFLESVPIPLPSLEEQKRIVGLLNQGGKIERLQAVVRERLRQLIPALFVRMFGDPVENPMGWASEPLGSLIEEGPQNGLYRPKSAYGSGTPILRIDGFYAGEVTDPGSWQRLRVDETTERRYALAQGDIVINRVNSRSFLGKSAIVPEIDEPVVFESNMMRLRVDPSRILPEFLVSLLQFEPIREHLCRNAKDAINQSSINQTDVREFLVLVPPLGVQRQYTKILETVRSTLAVAESGSRIASELGAALLPRVLGADT